jgi:hypothetical protein
MLLFICVVLFSYSNKYPWLKKNCRSLLFVLGVIPGIVGVIWGAWNYFRSPEPEITIAAFLLLELGAN